LLRYKAWKLNNNDALLLGCNDDADGWIQSRLSYIETDIGKETVPEYTQMIAKARAAVKDNAVPVESFFFN
jgi:hypothetical protein